MARRRATGQTRTKASGEREQHWRRIIAKQGRSGLTHTEFCRRESISAHSYFWWKRELGIRAKKGRKAVPRGARQRADEKTPSLVAVTIRQAANPAPSDCFEVVLSTGRLVRVRSGFDAESLKRLVAILEES